MRIFVSYTFRDNLINKVMLEELSNLLNDFGSPFIDILNNNSTNKQKRIEYEILMCDIFLLLITPSINNSNWVKIEKDLARKYKKNILELPFNRYNDKVYLKSLFIR